MIDKNSTLREDIAQHYAREIITGRLSPGVKLPGERDIAEKLSVSRSIVHLAMEQLAASELIEMRPRAGNFVLDFKKSGNLSTMMLMSQYGDSLMENDILIAIVELRNTVEGAAMRCLAEIGTAEDYKHLRGLCSEYESKAAEGCDIMELTDIYRQLHYEIAHRSGNCFYSMIMNSFGKINIPWVKCIEHWTADGIAMQNRNIVDMLEQGKGEEAAQYISDIFEQYRKEKNI